MHRLDKNREELEEAALAYEIEEEDRLKQLEEKVKHLEHIITLLVSWLHHKNKA
jgi:hypothetical protein